MISVASRQSPIHDELEHLSPTWVTVNGMPVAAHFGDPEGEKQQAKILALCDLSAPAKLGAKGAGAAAWLQKNGITVPSGIYQRAPLGKDGVVIRAGTSEFLVQDEMDGSLVERLLDPSNTLPESVYRYDRQDAGLVLVGTNSFQVLAETCGYDFRHGTEELIFSRVAGVSCMILRRDREQGVPRFNLWCDASYGAYLWEQLLDITRDAGGTAVGIQAIS